MSKHFNSEGPDALMVYILFLHHSLLSPELNLLVQHMIDRSITAGSEKERKRKRKKKKKIPDSPPSSVSCFIKSSDQQECHVVLQMH